jgi:hypothetical protein
VELHSRASDWRRHGHDRDPHYEKVILHVVWDGDGQAVAPSGRAIPTVSLSEVFSCSPEGLRRRLEFHTPGVDPCCDVGVRLGESAIERILDDLGDDRLRVKAGAFAGEMRGESAEEVLYRGVLRALGYTKNAEAFEELARRLPLCLLERQCRGATPGARVELLEALFLGKAGLLPRSDHDPLWPIWRRVGDGESMAHSGWRRFRVRPENCPERRLSGAAHLVSRFMETGLLHGVLERVAAAAPGTPELEQGLAVSATEPGSNGGGCLVGLGRAREIVVNIILPFASAWAGANRKSELARRALALYRGLPVAGEYGATRDLGRLLLGDRMSRVVNTARRQQGLVHVDRTYCRPRACALCPFGQ